MYMQNQKSRLFGIQIGRKPGIYTISLATFGQSLRIFLFERKEGKQFGKPFAN